MSLKKVDRDVSDIFLAVYMCCPILGNVLTWGENRTLLGSMQVLDIIEDTYVISLGCG